MDFSMRTNHNGQSGGRVEQPASKPTKSKHASGNLRIFSVVLLYSVTILIVALILHAFMLGGRTNKQAKLVDTANYQAVFLNGGQVYFGRIGSVNDKNLTLNDIYYLRVNQQVQPGQQTKPEDITLVKLGCELHGPQDRMVINQEQVIFWENLKEDGQVAKAVKQFQDKNPDGLKCEAPAASTDTTKKP